jgi:hypothetical protein
MLYTIETNKDKNIELKKVTIRDFNNSLEEAKTNKDKLVYKGKSCVTIKCENVSKSFYISEELRNKDVEKFLLTTYDDSVRYLSQFA